MEGMDLIVEEPAAPVGGSPFPTGLDPGDDGMPFQLDDQEVSPEEQAQYDQFVTRAMVMIHHQESRDRVLKALNNPNMTVHESVGRTTAMITKMVENMAAAAKVKLSPDVMFHGAQEIVGDLMEVGRAAGVFKLDDAAAAAETEKAFLSAVKMYGEALSQGKNAPVGEARKALQGQIANEIKGGAVDEATGSRVMQASLAAAVGGQ